MTDKPRIPLKGGAEFDGLTKAKQYYTFKPGERKRLKRKYNKRMRRQAMSSWSSCKICHAGWEKIVGGCCLMCGADQEGGDG